MFAKYCGSKNFVYGVYDSEQEGLKLGYSEEWLAKIQGSNNESHANRGKDLEKAIETSNKQYNRRGKAKIFGVPEPYKQISKTRTDGSFDAVRDTQAMPDYCGVFRGYGLLFDAKSTKVETRFDLKNIKQHQYKSLKDWHESSGISFLVVQFKTLDEIYYLPFQVLNHWWEGSNRKSIPYAEIAQERFEIESNGLVLVDYLSVLESEVIG